MAALRYKCQYMFAFYLRLRLLTGNYNRHPPCASPGKGRNAGIGIMHHRRYEALFVASGLIPTLELEGMCWYVITGTVANWRIPLARLRTQPSLTEFHSVHAAGPDDTLYIRSPFPQFLNGNLTHLHDSEAEAPINSRLE